MLTLVLETLLRQMGTLCATTDTLLYIVAVFVVLLHILVYIIQNVIYIMTTLFSGIICCV